MQICMHVHTQAHTYTVCMGEPPKDFVWRYTTKKDSKFVKVFGKSLQSLTRSLTHSLTHSQATTNISCVELTVVIITAAMAKL